MIHVLIADDHEVVRDGLRALLEIQPDIEVVGEAGDGQTAAALCEQLLPDVVLMDLRMPRMGGLAAIRVLQRTCPQVAVVILTTYDDDDLIVQGLRAGARGFLLKDASRDAILGAVRAAARGESLLSPKVMARLVTHLAASPGRHPRPEAASPLSERETEVLHLVAEGLRSKEIADRLEISERTVKAHLTSIFTKLGATSRAEAIVRAMERGLLEPIATGTLWHTRRE
ncbi:MAG TPA: response regulator transcription factor [Symbiobacteriaceae bacterium]